MAYFHTASYVLSRFSFLATHLVFAYWLCFMFNDPLHLGTNTLDVAPDAVKPKGQCTTLDVANLTNNLLLFALWWGSHSILARKAVKQALGLWEHPIERPLFATIASVMWFVNVHFWKPISDCSRWDVFHVSRHVLAVSATVMTLGSLLVVGLLWSLPDHVFGTNRYQYAPGKFPKGPIIIKFPYGLVRHPAAAGFLWMYWSLPAYTPNHILLASLWTVFILVGTLMFEEGGLKGNDEFGKKYLAYREQVNAFYPSLACISNVFFGKGGSTQPAGSKAARAK